MTRYRALSELKLSTYSGGGVSVYPVTWSLVLEGSLGLSSLGLFVLLTLPQSTLKVGMLKLQGSETLVKKLLFTFLHFVQCVFYNVKKYEKF